MGLAGAKSRRAGGASSWCVALTRQPRRAEHARVGIEPGILVRGPPARHTQHRKRREGFGGQHRRAQCLRQPGVPGGDVVAECHGNALSQHVGGDRLVGRDQLFQQCMAKQHQPRLRPERTQRDEQAVPVALGQCLPQRFRRLQIVASGTDIPMWEIGNRFEELHIAVTKGNWEMGVYHLEKMRDRMNTSGMKRPARTQNIEAMFFKSGAYQNMHDALTSKDASRMRAEFQNMRGVCMAGHKAQWKRVMSLPITWTSAGQNFL